MICVLYILFWLALALVIYTYIGYGIFTAILVKIKKAFFPSKKYNTDFEPSVSLIIPCFNEGDFISTKIRNTIELEYPADKLQVIYISDGSNDHSLDILKQNQEKYLWMHSPERKGKASAMNRAVLEASGEIVVFCDANTLLNREAIRELVAPYEDPTIGAVTGEKRILVQNSEHVSSAGEGLYWKYESWLKQLDSDLYSVVGAAGELMSYRKSFYEPLEPDTILDDFMQSMRVTLKGYRVAYNPKAYAMETASADVSEEWKRKVRISAGGWQSMSRLKRVLIPWPSPLLTYSYLSHRAFRWSVAPFSLLILIITNPILAFYNPYIYVPILAGQMLFYGLALHGYWKDKKGEKNKFSFVPYYFTMMNLAVFFGLARYLKGSQKATWERAKRA